ncbi:hypothetical protein [Methylobacterium sp. SyP6R]|uniref:hypothetical protein n=1 Tax=Methylobacterium sp. SyP6R TaxID=2718876 RepID=UPI001F45C2EF|nr:hypothetical protein [Methylobacterium sp. SyP6R]MCF4128055.1 hypothetical protein [Methylobacterium sp. SyP6R]
MSRGGTVTRARIALLDLVVDRLIAPGVREPGPLSVAPVTGGAPRAPEQACDDTRTTRLVGIIEAPTRNAAA